MNDKTAELVERLFQKSEALGADGLTALVERAAYQAEINLWVHGILLCILGMLFLAGVCLIAVTVYKDLDNSVPPVVGAVLIIFALIVIGPVMIQIPDDLVQLNNPKGHVINQIVGRR